MRPSSTINAANLQKPCGECHPSISARLAAAPIHGVSGEGLRTRAADIVEKIYMIAIVVIIGGMVIHWLLDLARQICVKRVLQKLARGFGIKRLLLEGGGRINGSFFVADLVDELSVLIAPIADGAVATPTLFDAAEGKCLARTLKLLSCERRKGDLLWLRYKVRRHRQGVR